MPDQLPLKLRWAYERGRLRYAALGVAVMIAWTGLAMWVGGTRATPIWGGVATALVTLALWRGRDLEVAAWSGAALALIPFTCALLAPHMSHACSVGGCSTWCAPMCAIGGAIAGGLLGYATRRKKLAFPFWLTSVGLIFCVGAMGCRCAGVASLVALGLSVCVSAGLPRLWRPAPRTLA